MRSTIIGEGMLRKAIREAPGDMESFGLTDKSMGAVKWIGSGSNGDAFLLPDGEHVLKLTSDQDEGGLAIRLLREGPIDGLPNVFYVGKIRSQDTPSGFVYLIVMELARPFIGPQARKFYAMLEGSRDVDDTDQNVLDVTSAIRFISRDDSATPDDAMFIATEEMDVSRDNLGVVDRHGRPMIIVVDLGQAQTMEYVDVALAKNGDAPMVVYTGTQVWDGRPYVKESRKGHSEHGPGLYFTTKLQTARKYAKGRGTVLRVEIDPSFRWLEDATVPIKVLVDWVASRRGLRKKSEIIEDIETRAGRGLPEGMGRVATLVNLMVNYEAITGAHGPALAEFLASLGIGASHVAMSGEDWVVLFDPAKVLSWRLVGSDDVEDLPRVRQ